MLAYMQECFMLAHTRTHTHVSQHLPQFTLRLGATLIHT